MEIEYLIVCQKIGSNLQLEVEVAVAFREINAQTLLKTESQMKIHLHLVMLIHLLMIMIMSMVDLKLNQVVVLGQYHFNHHLNPWQHQKLVQAQMLKLVATPTKK